eukprot:CAMPEP_0119005806 /NCGR_PEP_ID=MMETSP1176-20130426/1936_1 /TAXON_ID=265551 /ORGANISM="Synedropsis recta cf, Strain CCMP1620" /LENGTH=235 /DNA_ID=CAMNT_0006957651 /DNA_START=23 /DNA_END=730 /DNA_ORIENTATION=+
MKTMTTTPCSILLLLCLLVATATAFSPLPATTKPLNRLTASKNDDVEEPSFLQNLPMFTGGAFDGMDSEAAKVASRIRSVKDLGWTSAEKRAGSMRPRHRAFGGEGEDPIQSKANYDETNPQCVEKWLTQEEFETKFRINGPVADTIFVSLAGGGAFAERSVCEERIAQWQSNNGKFEEAQFLKTVKAGRRDLAVGWGIFGTAITWAACGILLPTNPTVKLLEGVIAQIQGGYVN